MATVTTRPAYTAYAFVEADSSKGRPWVKIAGVLADGTVDVDNASYAVPARLADVKALREALRPAYDTLTELLTKLEAEAAGTHKAPAPVADTRVDALAAKVDALTDAMTALAQLVARNAQAPAPAAPAPAAPAKNGAVKVAPAPANPLADLPF